MLATAGLRVPRHMRRRRQLMVGRSHAAFDFLVPIAETAMPRPPPN